MNCHKPHDKNRRIPLIYLTFLSSLWPPSFLSRNWPTSTQHMYVSIFYKGHNGHSGHPRLTGKDEVKLLMARLGLTAAHFLQLLWTCGWRSAHWVQLAIHSDRIWVQHWLGLWYFTHKICGNLDGIGYFLFEKDRINLKLTRNKTTKLLIHVLVRTLATSINDFDEQ
jgi:hypothetical protein